MPSCPICDWPIAPSPNRPRDEDALAIDCPHCGFFVLSRTAVSGLPGRLDEVGPPKSAERNRVIAALSHAVRKAQRGGQVPEFGSDAIKQVIAAPYLPDVRTQADNLIQWLGENALEPGRLLSVNPRDQGAVIGAASLAGFLYIVKSVIHDGLAEGDIKSWQVDGGVMHAEGAANLMLSFRGWDRFAALQQGATSSLTAFMALKFGDPVLDQIVDQYFRPAVAQTGFRLHRLDDEPRAGLIDDRMRVDIRNCRFLIADLSHGNKGAYWEAGYAEGLGKPVIYTCQKSVFENPGHMDRPHFDTNHHLTVVWDAAAPEEAIKSLKATIRATLPDARQRDD